MGIGFLSDGVGYSGGFDLTDGEFGTRVKPVPFKLEPTLSVSPLEKFKIGAQASAGIEGNLKLGNLSNIKMSPAMSNRYFASTYLLGTTIMWLAR